MAEGKKIEVRIAAVGGDQAAAEVRKLDAALGIVQKSEKELIAARAQFMTAAEAEVAEVERLVAANKKLDASQDALAANSQTATRSMAGMTQANNGMSASINSSRFAVQNAAFQFQDMAVQLEMGTSATRVFSQQVPQLLGSFGAVGAIAGAVIGVGVPLAAALFRSGKEAEDSAPKIGELKDRLEEFAEASREAAAEKRAEDNAAWVASLDEEEQFYDLQNQALKRQIELLRARRDAQLGVDTAQRDAAIATVEADPKKSDAEKIREVAAIREQDARAQAQKRLDDLAAERSLAEIAARDTAAKAQRQEQDAQDAERLAAEKKAADIDLQARIDSGKKAVEQIPEIEKQIRAERFAVIMGAAAGQFDQKTFDARQLKLAQLEQQLAEAQETAKKIPTSDEKKEAAAEAKQFRDAADAQRKEANAARQALPEASNNALAAREKEQQLAPLVVQEFDARSQARRTIAESAARKAEEREKQRKKIEDKKRLQEELQTGEAGLDANARERGLGLRGNRNDTVAAVGKALSDGTDAAELQKLGDKVSDAAGRNSAAMTQALLGIINKLEQQERGLEVVRQKLKNK